MRGRAATPNLLVVPLGFAACIAAVHGRSTTQSPDHDQRASEEERARLLAKGKELFAERCARCHNERGEKPLKTGPPLNERGLSAGHAISLGFCKGNLLAGRIATIVRSGASTQSQPVFKADLFQ